MYSNNHFALLAIPVQMGGISNLLTPVTQFTKDIGILSFRNRIGDLSMKQATRLRVSTDDSWIWDDYS
jgi:hypothetical protein